MNRAVSGSGGRDRPSGAVRPSGVGELSRRYLIALGVLAACIALSQVGVQTFLVRQSADARLVNLAGRQRMLSQKIARGALVLARTADLDRRVALVRGFERDLAQWRRVHRGLKEGDVALGLPKVHTGEVTRLLGRADRYLQAVGNAAERLARRIRNGEHLGDEGGAEVATILANDGLFLEVMDHLVLVYERQAHERVNRLRRVEIALAAGALLVILLTGLLILRPAVQAIRQTVADLAEARARFEEASLLDELTEIPNRRRFDVELRREYKRAAREGTSLSIVMIDVDHFKSLNDHLGHQAGDDCLRRIAAALAEVARRPGDLVARYGGDEFVALLPNTEPAGARAVAHRMQQSVLELAIPTGDSGALGTIAISVGTGSATPRNENAGPESLVATADAALYAGRATRRSDDSPAPAPSAASARA